MCKVGGTGKRGGRIKFCYFAKEQESRKQQYRKKGDGRVRTKKMYKVGGTGKKGGWGGGRFKFCYFA
jgi:hypothetical protein